MSPRNERRTRHSHTLEQLEPRIALTAQALTDVAVDVPTPEPQMEIGTFLANANQSSGVQYVHENYGFDGNGQTVAVIDSGIAWDHYALGGGFGEGYQVVGGWDFAENDANPYDDGPAGYHGTHVSGIIGSNDDTHRGVASGTDLVALRVFDDFGRSNFSWIEDALRWVHEHKDSFANPITTVNLSLGVNWNADSVPHWAQLEDEFALLEADGIFISVAAGNGFQQYQTPGLSYPAASPHVVPVASHDADGNMSSFSQRNQRVLVAPGSEIFSTVPDHLFGGSRSDQFLKGSGTSMAAPYVAGASTLVREAFEFMGQQDLTQNDIYRHFQDTATRFYDATTNAWYDRINVRAAIDAIVTDAHADQFANATDLGRLRESLSASGTIGKYQDIDTFAFTASETGTVTFEFSQTHELDAKFLLQDHSFRIEGQQISFDVVAGQEYRFSMETLAGIGHYQIDMTLEAQSNNIDATDWGTIVDSRFSTGSLQGESWFRMTPNQAGMVTAIGQYSAGEHLTFEFFDSQMNQIAQVQGHQGHLRLDGHFSSTDDVYLKVSGASDNVNVRMINLIGLESGQLTVSGTAGDDAIEWIDQSNGSFQVHINQVNYQFQHADIDHVRIDGQGGNDTLEVRLGQQADRVELGAQQIDVTNQHYSLNANGFRRIQVESQPGNNDSVQFNDTLEDEFFALEGNLATFFGAGFVNQANGFSQVVVNSSGGYDLANIEGTAQSERFELGARTARFESDDVQLQLNDFDRISINGNGGNDQLVAEGSQQSDFFYVSEHRVDVRTQSATVLARGFSDIQISGGGGQDSIYVVDSAANDRVVVGANQISLDGNYQLQATGVESIRAVSDQGQDEIQLNGGAGADHVRLTEVTASLTNDQMSVQTKGFQRATADGGGGQDTLEMIGSSGNERVYWMGDQTVMVGAHFYQRALGFEQIELDTGTGYDAAYLTGSSEREEFHIRRADARWEGESFRGQLRGVDRFRITSDGNDQLFLEGFRSTDSLQGQDAIVRALLNNVSIFAQNFERMDAYTDPGSTATEDIGAVDYLFGLHGDWTER